MEAKGGMVLETGPEGESNMAQPIESFRTAHQTSRPAKRSAKASATWAPQGRKRCFPDINYRAGSVPDCLDESKRTLIHAQIKLRTRRAFSKAIWPHLFRDCAVTELVDSAPDEIGIAPDLLGHTDLQTTRKHYIQAQGMTAHRLMQEAIAARRRAAALRRAKA